MAQRYKVPKEEQVPVAEQGLRKTVQAIFEKMGESSEDAAIGADTLVMSDLRGIESHGVSNGLRRYIDNYREGTTKARAKMRILRESPGTATIDADEGITVILGPKVMRIAMEKARSVGVGVVTLINSGHGGAIGHHAMIAADEDMIGVTMMGGGLLMVPTGGAEPRLGSNPIALAAPARNEAPFLLDIATSTIAGNKMRLADRLGTTIPGGLFAELDGTPVMKDSPARKHGDFWLLPLGSTLEMGSHKGYGLAMMGEILASLLGGVLPSMLEGPTVAKHYFAAYDIEAFTDVDTFKDNMDKTLRALRETKPAPGFDEVMYAGMAEHAELQKRRASGIPLHSEVIGWFNQTTDELDLPRLEVMS